MHGKHLFAAIHGLVSSLGLQAHKYCLQQLRVQGCLLVLGISREKGHILVGIIFPESLLRSNKVACIGLAGAVGMGLGL